MIELMMSLCLQQMLSHRQAEQIAMTILSDLLEGIRTPERPRSPIDTYITEEEIFLRKNPHVSSLLDNAD